MNEPTPAPITPPAEPPKIKVRACGLCALELNPGEGHLSKDHCIRSARQRIEFLRQITLGQAKELDWERTAIAATHRVAYILLCHFSRKGRVTLGRDNFEKVHSGAGVTINELPNGDFEVIAVLPAPPKEEKKLS